MSEPKKLLVGITGGIGAGKTLVAKIFNLLGVPIYYADDRAKWLMTNHAPLREAIVKAFGRESYQSDGSLNRSYLASKVFAEKHNTELINGLVHPFVGEDFRTWSHRQDTPYVLKEAALLFETGSYQELDRIITVTAPESLRIFRVLLRDPQRTKEEVKAIIDRQWADDKKKQASAFVIDNSEQKMVIPQVLKIHQQLIGPKR
ncbi:MAG: dephospho-CoA kinase [Lunatimonas sp.]|uniref:dephospho-CoA kinase n=1 Tax=Lunatimonas sp. TaxID=2060141 RepID=UPI00263A87B5|nr:dephospho-CoA kinase [Lunatimonas sp.]MCC5939762.1 dephospho-CoA kinase [Lunatimonas sp.]